MNNKWVKSQKVVNFSFENFDPTPYLASVPQENILRHKELLEQKSKNIRNHDCDDEITEFDLENEIATGNGDSRVCDIIQENGDVTDAGADNKSPTRSHPHHSIRPSRRKRLVSTSLTKTPVVDGQFIDFNNHKLKPSADPLDLKYKLYAVVVSFACFGGLEREIYFFASDSHIPECSTAVTTSPMLPIPQTNLGIVSTTRHAVKYPNNPTSTPAPRICCSTNARIWTICHTYQRSRTSSLC